MTAVNNNIWENHALVAGILAMIIAQGIKPLTHYVFKHEWDLVQIFSSGGMPSSHSAFVTATTMVVGFRTGFASPIFAVAMTFAIIVTYDAANVRWQSGLHAQRINQLMRKLFAGEPLSEGVLKEVIGHTPRQVYAGVLLGLAIGGAVEYLWR